MLSIVLGTRPEIIKLYPVIRECIARKRAYQLIHSGQHYDHKMDRVFFQQLKIPLPDYNLNVGSGTHAHQTAKILTACEKLFMKHNPHTILVQGDTNTVLSASLAASKLHIPIAHVEAGLRSNDKQMPEEINRILTDHTSTYCFAPTMEAAMNLRNEGIAEDRIHIVGNTIADSVLQCANIVDLGILNKYSLKPQKYILVTIHRQENVDNKQKLQQIFRALFNTHTETGLPILFPAHPRTLERIKKFNLEKPEQIIFSPPCGYLQFLALAKAARIILTDSGGVQEEACILKVPCVTLRENTERPETIKAGANILASTDPDRVVSASREMLTRPRDWDNPYGDGNTAKRILDILQ